MKNTIQNLEGIIEELKQEKSVTSKATQETIST
jgi:hypothetical protein